MYQATVVLFVIWAALAGSIGSAIAIDATPAAEPSLEVMGYPELVVSVSEDAIDLPAQVPAGLTLVTLVNASEGSWHGIILRLPDGMTADEAVAQAAASGDAPPEFLFNSTYPGFPGEVLPGARNQAVIDLVPGMYLVVEDFFQPFEVVASDTAAVATPSAAVPVRLFDYGFAFPDQFASGRQIWEVSNVGQEIHEVLLLKAPRLVTVDDVLRIMQQEPGGPATPGALAFEDLVPVGGLGWLSPGRTAWTVVDLDPGTYVALCFVPDPETGMLHVAMGMVGVFTVGEVATPAP